MNLDGKVALVTGGSRGIGRAVCLRLAAMGAKVFVNYVSRPEAAEETKALIEQNGGVAEIIRFNISQADEIQQALKDLIEKEGSIDVLVNNAGITRDNLIARMKDSEWDEVLQTNLKGAFLCSRAASKSMMKRRWGRIINISSVIGFIGNIGQANYAAAKAGLVGLAKSLAKEYASRNITVNCVAPGFVKTEMTEKLDASVKEQLMNQIPLKALGEVEDIAAAVAFLASEDARYITGQTIHVNGGMFM